MNARRRSFTLIVVANSSTEKGIFYFAEGDSMRGGVVWEVAGCAGLTSPPGRAGIAAGYTDERGTERPSTEV